MPQPQDTKINDKILPLVRLIEGTTGLDDDQARTIIYFAMATYGLPELQKFPILTISGQYGTGKTTLLEILKEIAYKPPDELLNAAELSRPALRDSLRPDATDLIDEADDMGEEWLIKRYDRAVASHIVKRPIASTKGELLRYEDERLNLFGAIALHRRKPFKDPAVLSRSIVVRTKYKGQGIEGFNPELFRPFAEKLAALAKEVPWNIVEANQGNRIYDTWEPLMFAAHWLEDYEWYKYADIQIKKANANSVVGREDEPTPAIFRALISLVLDADSTDELEPKERVLLAEVTKAVETEGHRMTSYQVGQALREMGFETENRGGRIRVYSGGMEKLIEVAQLLGVHDELLQAQ